MTTIVQPDGHLDAPIVLCGEAPGVNELHEGRGFVGASGKLLWTLLHRHGITRSNCYVTNVIKTATAKTPLASLPATELIPHIDATRTELQMTRANVYVPIGALALYTMLAAHYDTNDHGRLNSNYHITDWRGSIIQDTSGRKCIPTIHPAHVLRNPDLLPELKHDVALIANESLTPTRNVPQWNIITNPTVKDVAFLVVNILRDRSPFAYDIETAGGVLLCIAIATEDISVSIPLAGQPYWQPKDFVQVMEVLRTLFASDVPKIAQNGSYDIIGLSAIGIEVKPPLIDTLHKHHVLDPRKPHSLAYMLSMYTRQPYYKSWDVAPQSEIANLREYNATDAASTLALNAILDTELSARRQTDFYQQHYADLHPYLLRMYNEGIAVDRVAATQLARQLDNEASRLEHTIATGLSIKQFNINSPQQMAHLLYDTLKLPLKYNRDKYGKQHPTTDDDALLELYVETQNGILLQLRNAKKKRKLQSFLDPISPQARKRRNSWDGRMRTEYRPTTETGRLASQASTATDSGTNLQNIPPRVRSVFVPAKGYVFLEPDYRQAEAIVITYDSSDEDMIHKFEHSRLRPQEFDIHWYNAELIMERPHTELRKEDRNACKHVVYGTYYGMHEKLLQMTIMKHSASGDEPPIYIPLAECKRRQERYITQVPKLRERQSRIRRELLSFGQQFNCFGQSIRYHEILLDRELTYCFGYRDYDKVFREAYSFIPQSTIARMINLSLMRIDDLLRASQRGRVCAQVHDSLLLEVKADKDSILWAYGITRDIMETPVHIRGRQMIVPTEFKLGNTWCMDKRYVPCAHEKIYSAADMERAWEEHQACL
jgi:uracil-DNA glycosylase family 4